MAVWTPHTGKRNKGRKLNSSRDEIQIICGKLQLTPISTKRATMACSSCGSTAAEMMMTITMVIG